MRQPKIGDIVEIRTCRGLTYFQFTHKHKTFGALIRILKGAFESKPSDLRRLADGETLFVTFFPLGAAVKQGVVSIIGNMPVPEHAQMFPIFRAGTPDQKTKRVANWWLWDGEKEWMVGQLTPDQQKLPIRGIWNDTLLIERLDSGWLPEKNAW